jgi:RNA polymerase sigma factor (sigma-70 family)
VGQADLHDIYLRHRQGLFTLALSVAGSVDGAEDAVQEAFSRLCRSGVRGAGDPVAYVFACVRNAATDAVRRRRREPRRKPPVSIFAAGPSPDGAAAEDERRQVVSEAVERLPPELREAVILRVYAGLTFAQVADVVGAPLPTVATRYRRALERLREVLQEVI